MFTRQSLHQKRKGKKWSPPSVWRSYERTQCSALQGVTMLKCMSYVSVVCSPKPGRDCKKLFNLSMRLVADDLGQVNALARLWRIHQDGKFGSEAAEHVHATAMRRCSPTRISRRTLCPRVSLDSSAIRAVRPYAPMRVGVTVACLLRRLPVGSTSCSSAIVRLY